MRLGFLRGLIVSGLVAANIVGCDTLPPDEGVTAAATEAATAVEDGSTAIVPWRSVAWTGAWHFETEYGNVTTLQIYQITAAQTGADGRVEIALPFSCTDYPTTNVLAAPYANVPLPLQ